MRRTAATVAALLVAVFLLAGCCADGSGSAASLSTGLFDLDLGQRRNDRMPAPVPAAAPARPAAAAPAGVP